MDRPRHIAQDSASRRTLFAAALRRWLRRAQATAAERNLGELLRMFVGGARLRATDLTPVDNALFRSGRYVHRRRSGLLPSYRVLPFSLPEGVDCMADTRFVLNLEQVTTYCGFSLAPDGWHPFVEVLREYEQNPDLRYEDSVLCRLYSRLTPATVTEALYDEPTEALGPLDSMPASHDVMKSLWQLDARAVRALVAQAPHRPLHDGPSRYLGPKSTAAGRACFDRLLLAYASVRRHGYDPARFGGRRPRGFFLVRDGRYRFVMSRGNYRMAVLRALGHTRIVATVRVHHPPVVDEAQLARWSTDQGGPYPLDVAGRLFDRMFAANGAERAKALGLR